jgi:hypothetical protein
MRSHRWRFSFLLLLVVVGLGATWIGWQAWKVNRELSAVASDAETLQDAVTRGDTKAANGALAALREHSAGAVDDTGTTTWTVLTKMPVVGDDATGIRVISNVMADLSADGIDPLVRTSQDLGSLLPKKGRISIKAVRSLQAPVRDGETAFSAASRTLAAEDPSGYTQALRDRYRELERRVSQAAEVLRTAHTALEVMPSMLGEDEPRNYLLVFQNNAEIRATGGLPGAVSLISASHGRVRMTRQIAANMFGSTNKPVLPLTTAEKRIYGAPLGTYFLDANFTPDFPRTADLMKARWEQVYPQDDLDGVFSLDPVTLSYILEATGPIQVGDLSLTPENTVDELLHEVYMRFEDPAAQDAWFRLVARRVFEGISSGTESPQALVRALNRGADEGRVYVHSFVQEDQDAISGSEVAGHLVMDPEAPPQVGVYLNDATGGKMSYYLRYRVQVDSTYCRNDVQGLSATAHLLSSAPSDAANLPDYVTGAGKFGTKPGSQLVLVRLYSPVGGDVSGVQLNGRAIDLEPVEQDGRQVATVVVSLKPAFTVDLTWRMKTGPGQTEDTMVDVTPSVVEGNASSRAVSSCA